MSRRIIRGLPVAARIRGQNFIAQNDFAVFIEAEFEFRVDEDKPVAGGDVASAREYAETFRGDIVPLRLCEEPLFHDAGDLLEGAINWLIGQKTPNGTWPTTAGTVMSLKALIAAEGSVGSKVTGESGQRFGIVILPAKAGDLVI